MERTKEEELNIVLKNYDKVKAERDRFQKENEDLKKKLVQQEILYKNMLATYSERKEILPKKWNGKEIRSKFDALNAKYEKLQELYQKRQEYIDEKAIKIKNLADENVKMKNMLDSLRGALCSAHNKADSFCFQLNISSRGEECLSQDQEEQPKEVAVVLTQERPTNRKEFQQQQFVKYIRELAAVYKSTGTLNGISSLAQKYGVATLTKIKFFQYRLDEEPLSDEEILEVYERLKKKIL